VFLGAVDLGLLYALCCSTLSAQEAAAGTTDSLSFSSSKFNLFFIIKEVSNHIDFL
jgi:hypothetical protein